MITRREGVIGQLVTTYVHTKRMLFMFTNERTTGPMEERRDAPSLEMVTSRTSNSEEAAVVSPLSPGGGGAVGRVVGS